MTFKQAKILTTLIYMVAIILLLAYFMLQTSKLILAVAVVVIIIGAVVNAVWGRCPYCKRTVKVNMFSRNLKEQKCSYCGEHPFVPLPDDYNPDNPKYK